MSNSIKSKVLILRAVKYGEADLILQALTNGGEKISLLARGALKSKKRFAGGVLEPTHFVEVRYKKSYSENKIATLEEATLLNGFEKLRTSYEKVEVAFYVLECLSKVSQEGDAVSDRLFNLAGHSLKSLENAEDLKLFRVHFCLKGHGLDFRVLKHLRFRRSLKRKLIGIPRWRRTSRFPRGWER